MVQWYHHTVVQTEEVRAITLRLPESQHEALRTLAFIEETSINDQFARLPDTGMWIASGAMLVPRHGFELAMYQGRAWACGGGSLPGLHPVATCTSVS